jgi:hypothetical protein
MNWKARISIALAALAMVFPKVLDELADLLDDDPATIFSWRFMLSLLSGPVVAFCMGEAISNQNKTSE